MTYIFRANLTEYYAVVGLTEVDLLENATHPGTESNIGDVITDSMLDAWNGEANMAFINNGGIRGNIVEGEITGEDIYYVLPFGNTVDKARYIRHMTCCHMDHVSCSATSSAAT